MNQHKVESTAVPRLERLLSVRQLVEHYPGLFTEGSLRWTIFRRRQNGFGRCIVRMGRRILIDTDQLRIWMAANPDPLYGARRTGTR